MDLNELKSTWRESGGVKKSQTELQLMTKIKNHPKMKRTRIKLVIETIFLVVFLSVYYEILDGANKPLWANYTLIISTILFVVNDITGYLTLLNPVQGYSIATSLKNLHLKLKRLLIFSVLTSFAFAVSLFLFLTLNVQLTRSKYVLLVGMILTLGILTYISYKIWLNRIGQINQSALEFSETTKET